MRYLGYLVDRNGLRADPEKLQAMLQLPVPKSVKEVRRVVGTFSWYRRFVPEFANLIPPLTALLKKSNKFVWTHSCDDAFKRLKEYLISAPVLSCPNYDLPFVVETDASDFGVGAVLLQPHEDGDKVISYLSRSLSKQERNYSTTKKECLAVLLAIEKLRPYLEGVSFCVVTDHHSLVWLQNLKDPTGRLARWSLRLQQYDFKIVHRPGKHMVVPDTLSRSVPVIEKILMAKDRWMERLIKNIENNPTKFSNFRVSNGRVLKYVIPHIHGPGNKRNCWKEAVSKENRRKLIADFHDNPTAGHLGITKTYSRLAERYFWPKMKCDVVRYIRKCHICNTRKPDQQGAKGLMTAQPKPSQP